MKFSASPLTIPLLYLLVCVVMFGISLTYGFVWDDMLLVWDRDILRSLANWREILFMPYLNTPAGGVYRPLPLLTFAANFSLFGEGGWSFHAVNLLLHALNAWLVFALIRRLTNDARLGFWAGLWFAVLPIHTEAIAAVVGRLELLAATFGLTTLLLLLSPTLSVGRVFTASACFLAAMLSKEHAIAMLPLYVCVTWVLAKARGRRLTAALWDIRRPLLWLSTAVAIYLLGFRLPALGVHAFTSDVTITRIENFLGFLPFWTRVGTAFKTVWLYTVKLFWPVTLSTDYGFAQIAAAHLSDWQAWAGVAIVAALAWLAIRPLVWRKDRWLWSVAALMILWPFLPVSNFFVITGTNMGDRLMYLPSVGACLLLAMATTALPAQPARLIGTLALVLLLSFYGWRGLARTLDWRDEHTLLASAAVGSPKSLRVRTDVATEWLYAGRDRDAERELLTVLQLQPDYFYAVHNLGLVYKRQHRYALAKRQFWHALRCAYDVRVFRNLALVEALAKPQAIAYSGERP